MLQNLICNGTGFIIVFGFFFCLFSKNFQNATNKMEHSIKYHQLGMSCVDLW